MATITTNLGLTKPAVGADADQWGDQLNASLDVLDAKVLNRATGGSVTGPISATGAVSGASLAATGAVTGATATFTGAASAGSLSTTGALSAGAASVTTLTGSGAATFPSVTTPIVNAVTALALQTGGTTKATLDNAGNLGLGVVPSNWSGQTALQQSLGSLASGAGEYDLSYNTFFNAGFKYVSTGFASQYSQNSAGTHRWFTAPSGTAGAPITFTQAMTLTQGGNLLVGTTADPGAKLNVGGSVRIPALTSYQMGDGSAFIYTDLTNNGIMGFGTGSAERARITSGGYFKASNTGVYGGVAGLGDLAVNSFHILQGNANSETSTIINGNTGSAVINLASFLASGATGVHFRANTNLSTVFQVLANGNVQNTNNSYGAISDAKLKENVTDAAGFLDRLQQVRVVNYTLKADESKARLLGVIAQELQQVFPGLIEETPDMRQVEKTRVVEVPAVDAVIGEDGEVITPAVPATTREETYTENEPTGEVTKAVKYSVFVPMLIKALQEETEARKALETRIAALEAK